MIVFQYFTLTNIHIYVYFKHTCAGAQNIIHMLHIIVNIYFKNENDDVLVVLVTIKYQYYYFFYPNSIIITDAGW